MAKKTKAMTDLLTTLDEALKPFEKGCRGKGKRTGAIEDIQQAVIRQAVTEIEASKKYPEVKFDIEDLDTSRGETRRKYWYLKENGELSNDQDSRNKAYDTKSFDSIVKVSIDGKDYTIFFIEKGVQNQGGSQDMSLMELGNYTRAIEKNTNEDVYYIFQIDGEYLSHVADTYLRLSPRKMAIAGSGSIRRVIEEFIAGKLGR